MRNLTLLASTLANGAAAEPAVKAFHRLVVDAALATCP